MRQGGDGAAWRQGLWLAAVAIAIAAALWHARARPFDHDTLGIAIAELQSNAAEGELLSTLDAGHAVPAATRVAHVAQMRRQQDQLRKQLRDKHAPPELAQAREEAIRIGEAVDANLMHVAATAFDPAIIAAFHALAGQAGALKDQVDPE